jgi:hypothetical protein
MAKTFSTPVCAGDLLEALEPLDVGLERLPAEHPVAAADRVGGLGQHRFERAHLDLVVVGLDGVHDVLVLAVAACDLGADDRVAALHLVGERLADVVQQRAALHQGRVQPQLARHHPARWALSTRCLRTFWPYDVR